MLKEDKNNSFLFWTPAVVGASITGNRIYRDLKTLNVNPKRWFWDPGHAGRAARDVALSAQVAHGAAPGLDYGTLVNDMFLKGTWKNGLNASESRRAVAEATRSSLLRNNAMSLQDVQSLSSRIMNSPNIPMEDVIKQVQKFGNPQVFFNTMQNYNVHGFTPGTFFSPQDIKGMFEGAATKGMAVRNILPSNDWSRKRLFTDWWKNDLSAKETGRLQGMLSTLREGDLGVGAAVTSISQYPGDIKMAHVSLIKKGMPNISIDLPLHPTIYRRPSSAFVMGKMYKGLPSSGGKVMDFGDYYVGELKDKVLPDVRDILTTQTSKRQIRHAIKNRLRSFEEGLSQYMFNTKVASHPGQDLLNGMNSQVLGVPELSSAMGYKGPGNVVDIDTEMGILFQQGKFPGLSSKAIMSGKVWAGEDPRSLWAYGKDFPFEERPFQMLREFAPTKNALQQMASSSMHLPGLKRNTPFLGTTLTNNIAKIGLISPQLAIGYALPGGKAEQVLQGTGLAEEELLIHKKLMGMYETSRLSEVNISLNEAIGHGSSLADWIKKASTPGTVTQPFKLNPGERIGYELSSGEPISALNASGVQQQIIGAEFVSKTNAVKLSIQESFAASDYVKLFGHMKATTKARDEFYMSKVMKRLGLPSGAEQVVDGMTFLNKVKKNRTLLQQQMASGLGILTSQRIQELERAGSQSPLLSEMKQFMGLGGSQIEKMLPNELAILQQAKKWDLNLQLIGGAMPFAKDIVPSDIMAQATALAGDKGLIHPSGMVLGLASPRVGAYRTTVGGGVVERGVKGSMEPRGFQQLLQHQWISGENNIAEMISGDLASRMENYGSDLTEAMNITKSISGQKLTGLDVKSVLQSKGLEIGKNPYMLDLGINVPAFGGSSQLYVPGQDTMKRFGTFRSPEGELMQTDLMRAYNNVHRTAVNARNVSNSTEAINSLNTAAEALNKTVMREIGTSMYGRGGGSGVAGALRGRVKGSQYLPLSATDIMMQEAVANTIEVSEKAGNEMFNELINSSQVSETKQFLTEQRKAFMSGGSVTGTIARHPFIGPYSIQPTFIRKSELPTSKAENFITTPARSIESIATSMGKMDVNMSPVVGLAADYDDDRLTISLIGDQKTAKATEDLLKGGKYTQEYKRFAAESTVLSSLAKKQLGPGSSELDDVQRMIVGSGKLRVTAAETGNISSAISEAKLAMSYYKPESASKFNVIAEMMEQQIISGKKMKDIQSQNIAKETAGALRSIHREDSIQTLENITRSMFGPELESGVNIQSQTGNWTIKTDVHQMWSDVQNALAMGREKGGVVSRYNQMAKGKMLQGTMATNEVLAMLETARIGKMDNLSNLATRGISKEAGFMNTMVKDTIKGINQGIKETGLRARSWGKPLLFGLMGTVAATMLLSRPKMQELSKPVSLSGGNKNINQDNQMLNTSIMNSANNPSRDLRPENMSMPSFKGNPGTPRMMTPETYLAGPEQKFQVKARASGGYTPDYQSISNSLGQYASGNTKITFNDNRRKMTSQDISSMLEGF